MGFLICAFMMNCRPHNSIVLSVLISFIQSLNAFGKCPGEALVLFPYVVDHAVWRSWDQAIIFTPDLKAECQWAILRLAKCLSVNGIASSLNVQSVPRVNINIGVMIIMSRLSNNATVNLIRQIKQINNWKLNYAADWLIAARSIIDFRKINSLLNETEIRFDQNIVVAYPDQTFKNENKLTLCQDNFDYQSIGLYKDKNNKPSRNFQSIKCSEHNQTFNCFKKHFENNYYRTSKRFLNIARNKEIQRNGNVVRLLQAGKVSFNYSKPFKMLNMSKFSMRHFIRENVSVNDTSMKVFIMQYFKVRSNSTLYASYLGHWSKEKSMSLVEMLYPVEARSFMGESLIVGRRNSTADENSLPSDEERPSTPELFNDLLFFLTVRLNGTSVTRYYSQLGFRTYEGVWSGLLGALSDRSVDIALEPITELPLRQQDMDFIFPIAETMCNIYIRNQETSSVRDIFLSPFSPRLIVCVIAVLIVNALAIVLICRLSKSKKVNNSHKMSCTEALIWSTGILCQQGGTWTPSNPAASILLIVCLFFAVVTYNAYAAFITSVLSVRVANVGTVADVLGSPNMKIGYIRNGEDQIYLMSTKDVQLNAFYIRGYSEAENLVSSAEEGLARAASQDYAFFAEQRSARSTLKSLSQARGRCALRELPVHSTRSQLSFPLPRTSPYSKPILISLLQLRSGGTLSKLARTLVPAMPECAPPSGFASARAADVQTAFLVIITGLILSLFIGIGEYCWMYRKKNKRTLKKFYRRLYKLLW